MTPQDVVPGEQSLPAGPGERQEDGVLLDLNGVRRRPTADERRVRRDDAPARAEVAGVLGAVGVNVEVAEESSLREPHDVGPLSGADEVVVLGQHPPAAEGGERVLLIGGERREGPERRQQGSNLRGARPGVHQVDGHPPALAKQAPGPRVRGTGPAGTRRRLEVKGPPVARLNDPGPLPPVPRRRRRGSRRPGAGGLQYRLAGIGLPRYSQM